MNTNVEGATEPPESAALRLLSGTSSPPRETVFYGRQWELDRLGRALTRIRHGGSAGVVVVGEAGSGKSRLVAEALSRSPLEGVTILSGHAYEFEAERPFGVLIDAIDIRDTADPERAAIARLIARGSQRRRAETRHEIPMAIDALVDRLSASGPIGLVLEDLQWADPLTAITIGRLLETLRGRRAFVVMTMRSLPVNIALEEVLANARNEVDRIELEPLGEWQVTTLVTSLVGRPPGPRLAALAAAAGGNPGLLVALVLALKRDGALTLARGVAETDATLPPQSMRHAVLARLNRLPDGCRDLLTVAAVIGRPFGIRTLAAAVGRRAHELLTDLRCAMLAGMLDDRAGFLHFRQELLRASIYEGLSPALRSTLHLRVAHALLADGAEATEVAPHLAQASALPGTTAAATRRSAGGAEPLDQFAWGALTRAERIVIGMVRQGLTNRQIGERLSVSPRTVETHLSHAFGKLGVISRVALVGAMAEHALTEHVVGHRRPPEEQAAER
jgi:predicted ATPase/DNA-binding CsgD family transcriptional regulator